MHEAAALKPKFRAGISLPWLRAGHLRLVLPFRRPLGEILTGVVITGLFSVPVINGWNALGVRPGTNLVSVTVDVSISLMLLVSLIAFAGAAFTLLALLVGREVVVVRPGLLSWRLDILGIQAGADYEAAHIRNLRRVVPANGSRRAWRGPHVAFDYGGKAVGFGTHIDEQRATEIIRQVQAGLGTLPAGATDAAAVTATAAGFVPAGISTRPEPAHAVAADGAGTASPWLLILANVVPLAGVVLLDWNLGHVMVLYWLESAIIGFFNILKMVHIGGWSAFFDALFFTVHFGLFMAVHFLFISGLFIAGPGHRGGIPLSLVADLAHELWPAALALFVSHGWSWRVNFIGRREYLGRTLKRQMLEPYKRILVMHVTVIVGAFLTMSLGTSVPALALLVFLKTAADLHAHRREHQGGTPAGAAAGQKA